MYVSYMMIFVKTRYIKNFEINVTVKISIGGSNTFRGDLLNTGAILMVLSIR